MLRGLVPLLAGAFLAVWLVPRFAAPPPPNVLLVTIETLRADHAWNAADMPTLARLAARGAAFPRAYAAASFTLPSLHTLATGEPPMVHGVRFWTQFGNRYRGGTLAGVFRDAGYRTGFVYSAQGMLDAWPVLQRDWTDGKAMGFDRRDGAPVAAAGEWLDRRVEGEPFFLWVHLFEPHTPYAPDARLVASDADRAAYAAAGPAGFPVEDWVARVPGGGGARLADELYTADVRAADAALAELLADLARRGLADRTVVCVVSDHGENLSRDPAPRWDHGVSTDEQLLRVPLAFAGPGVPRRADTGLARHLDVPPTLLRLARLEPPSGWTGRDLFGVEPPPRFAIAECTMHDAPSSPMYSVTDGEHSLRIFTHTAPWRVELRAETQRGVAPLAVSLDDPPDAVRPFTDVWNASAAAWRARAAVVNDLSMDDVPRTPEQQSVIDLGGPYVK